MWRCTKDLCCHIFFADVVDVITVFGRQSVLSELLSANDLVLMSETM